VRCSGDCGPPGWCAREQLSTRRACIAPVRPQRPRRRPVAAAALHSRSHRTTMDRRKCRSVAPPSDGSASAQRLAHGSYVRARTRPSGGRPTRSTSWAASSSGGLPSSSSLRQSFPVSRHQAKVVRLPWGTYARSRGREAGPLPLRPLLGPRPGSTRARQPPQSAYDRACVDDPGSTPGNAPTSGAMGGRARSARSTMGNAALWAAFHRPRAAALWAMSAGDVATERVQAQDKVFPRQQASHHPLSRRPGSDSRYPAAPPDSAVRRAR
jgi:hypothetical protein